MNSEQPAENDQIDPAWIAAIVREVTTRLRSSQSTPPSLVTVATIQQHSGSTLTISPATVVTPAARDEARRRGIRLQETATTSIDSSHLPKPSQIIDRDRPERAQAVCRQLRQRHVALPECQLILSDSPAQDVYQQISGGQRAVMITAVEDVNRFQRELAPTVWVLDMQRLNLPAAVNAAARIAQQHHQRT